MPSGVSLDNPLRINAAGNVVLCDESFLNALKRIKPPTREPATSAADASAAGPSRSDNSDSSHSVSANTSGIAPLYLGSLARGNMRGFSLSRELRMMGDANPIAKEEWLATGQEFLQFMDGAGKKYGISVNNRREMIDGRWGAWINYAHPNLDLDSYWLKTTVVGNWKLFFVTMIKHGKGRSGDNQSDLRSNTVQQWALTFVWLVGRKTTDETGKYVGVRLLQSEGLYVEIKEHVSMLVHELGLVRHAQRQAFIGRVQLLLMIRAGIRDSEEYGRKPFQQTTVVIVFILYMGARTGSLGFSNIKYRDLEHYMKLGDLTIERLGRCQWAVTVDIKYRKGYNMTVDAGVPQQFRLTPVTKAHNILFDAGMHVLLLLLMREALTLQDVIDYDKQWFEIKPEMRNQPLFLERTPGGYHFGKRAASGDGLTQTIKRLGERVNIQNATGHGIRRETGNRTGLIMGTEAAQMQLGHEGAQTTFNTSYSHNTLNLQVAEIALGDLDHVAPAPNQLTLRRLNRSEGAARALLSIKLQRSEVGDEHQQNPCELHWAM
ncbi:hypothetical protein FS749_008356 [Ceratobasidium sp. UAMH 11750]|nr:hypothetical protein FS749_008356 [Ceratobasidium sp. UAMH 11750]